MKKGDLMRYTPSDAWGEATVSNHGYLWLVKSVATKSVMCTSIATGETFIFHIKSLEQANETD